MKTKIAKSGKFIVGFIFTAVMLLGGVFAIAATPSVTISPNTSTIAPGTTITVTGTGFPTGSGLVVSVNNINKGTLFPDPSGNVSMTISSSDSTINTSGTNTISFTATDATNRSLAVSGSPLAFTIDTGSATPPANVNTPTTDCTKDPQSPNCVVNPLKVDNLTDFILQLMKWLLGIIGIFAVLFIMIGGFKMVTAQGKEEAVTAARNTITWAIIGLVVAVLSFSMIAIVENLLQANINTSLTQSK